MELGKKLLWVACGWMGVSAPLAHGDDLQDLIPTVILVEPQNARPDTAGGMIICPIGSDYQFTVLPVTYDLQGGVKPHSCVGNNATSDSFCQQELDVAVNVTGAKEVIWGKAQSSQVSKLCANLDPSDPACEPYDAPTAIFPQEHLTPGLVATLQGIWRKNLQDAEPTNYNHAVRDVAFSAILAPALANVSTPVRFGSAGSDPCK